MRAGCERFGNEVPALRQTIAQAETQHYWKNLPLAFLHFQRADAPLAYRRYRSCPHTQQLDEFEKAGAAIGTGIGVMAIFTIWVIGDIITGLLALMTRPK